MYDTIVVGAGPSGIAASLTAAKHKLKTLLIASQVPSYSAAESGVFLSYASLVQKAVAGQDGLEVELNKTVVALEKNVVSFSIETVDGKLLYSRAVVVATGENNGAGNTSFTLLAKKDSRGKVFVDANQQTNIPGLYAAGDVTVVQAQGLEARLAEGVKAALSLKEYLKIGL